MANKPQPAALEVFVNNIGTITIRQDLSAPNEQGESSEEEGPMVLVHPDDVSLLIMALEDARRKARRGAAEEREEITMPAIVYPRRPVSSP